MNDRIEEREVHLWIASTVIGSDPSMRRCLSLLDDKERARAEQFRIGRKRVEFIIAHALVRTAISHYVAADPRGLTFREGIHGKPEMASPRGGHQLRFNLSHADGLAVCAAANDEVGVDVENTGRRIDALEIAERFFAPSESQTLRGARADERALRFFELWTLKESMLKGLGRGLEIPLARFSFAVQAGNEYPKYPAMIDNDEAHTDDSGWRSILLRPRESHLIAVAMRGLEKVIVHDTDL